MQTRIGNVLAIGLLAFAVSTLSALAKDDWREVANVEVTKSGGREVAVSGTISKIRFQVDEGSVVINTGVVRQGGQKTPFTVGQRIEKGAHVDVDVGQNAGVTGIRVSEDGRGKYRIFVQP